MNDIVVETVDQVEANEHEVNQLAAVAGGAASIASTVYVIGQLPSGSRCELDLLQRFLNTRLD